MACYYVPVVVLKDAALYKHVLYTFIQCREVYATVCAHVEPALQVDWLVYQRNHV